jgi:hypothetical protein
MKQVKQKVGFKGRGLQVCIPIIINANKQVALEYEVHVKLKEKWDISKLFIGGTAPHLLINGTSTYVCT